MAPRPRPDEDSVREQLREERKTMAEEDGEASEDGASPDSAVEDPDAASAEAQPPGSGDPDTPSDGSEPSTTGLVDDGAPAAEADPERQRDEYLALAQRTQADFDNYRKRAAREVSAAGHRAKVGLARDLLPAIDNLERALEAAGVAEEGLAQGVRLVHDELIAALGRSGIERFDPRGERFDPEHHEAIATRPEDGVESGLVLDVAQKGYRAAETVVRPARVVVSA
jgi:molecular chaperone GrpE